MNYTFVHLLKLLLQATQANRQALYLKWHLTRCDIYIPLFHEHIQ